MGALSIAAAAGKSSFDGFFRFVGKNGNWIRAIDNACSINSGDDIGVLCFVYYNGHVKIKK